MIKGHNMASLKTSSCVSGQWCVLPGLKSQKSLSLSLSSLKHLDFSPRTPGLLFRTALAGTDLLTGLKMLHGNYSWGYYSLFFQMYWGADGLGKVLHLGVTVHLCSQKQNESEKRWSAWVFVPSVRSADEEKWKNYKTLWFLQPKAIKESICIILKHNCSVILSLLLLYQRKGAESFFPMLKYDCVEITVVLSLNIEYIEYTNMTLKYTFIMKIKLPVGGNNSQC